MIIQRKREKELSNNWSYKENGKKSWVTNDNTNKMEKRAK